MANSVSRKDCVSGAGEDPKTRENNNTDRSVQRKNKAYVSVPDDVTETNTTTRKGAEQRTQEGGHVRYSRTFLRRDS